MKSGKLLIVISLVLTSCVSKDKFEQEQLLRKETERKFDSLMILTNQLKVKADSIEEELNCSFRQRDSLIESVNMIINRQKSSVGSSLKKVKSSKNDPAMNLLNLIDSIEIRRYSVPYNKGGGVSAGKPIIYCYPTDTTDLTVKQTFPQGGKFTYTYPTYPDSGWQVTAFPDGRLLDKQGKSYYSLFWEGEVPISPDDSTGFIVHRDSLNTFFENSLDSLGLNYREKQEFIVYWAPKLMDNEYSFIHFSRKNYAESAKLEISPTPTTVNRFLMLYRKADGLEKIAPQKFENPGRTGFTVVEWGGAKLVEGGSCEIK